MVFDGFWSLSSGNLLLFPVNCVNVILGAIFNKFFLNVKVKSKTITAKTITKARVKKVYTLTGQKYDPPEEVRSVPMQLISVFSFLFLEECL